MSRSSGSGSSMTIALRTSDGTVTDTTVEQLDFTAIVRAHQRSVYSLALRMVSDRHEAEDLAQEVFLRLHHHLASLESEVHLIAWLRKVTVHRAIDRLRQPRQAAAQFDEAIEVPQEPNERD